MGPVDAHGAIPASLFLIAFASVIALAICLGLFKSA
jgi:hypothetical protein